MQRRRKKQRCCYLETTHRDSSLPVCLFKVLKLEAWRDANPQRPV
uniref:Uncharacterized protein n=1 Tax=Anguilla anguilla TaxID=7936 RepID=A0A0E9SRC3_ANGAN